MLKKRVAATLVVRDGILVQSIGFNKFLPVGSPEIAAEFLNQWGIDEIILLDISATRERRVISKELVSRVSSRCFVPLTAGGGIQKIEEVDELIQTGADKISLNHVLHSNASFVSKVAGKYGSQCVVVALDILKMPNGNYNIYDYLDKKVMEVDVEERVKLLEESGAGEILINAVHKDGTYTGFDIELINKITSRVNIPVIAMGGAGQPGHFVSLFSNSKVDAGCAANFFHFSEHSVILTKQVLLRNNINIRLETHAQYEDAEFNEKYRLNKKPDNVLEDMLFIKIEKDII